LAACGALAVVKRQSELKIREANAGAKLPECTACPNLSGSASLCPKRVLAICCFSFDHLVGLY